jgi:predicted dehydrogenase
MLKIGVIGYKNHAKRVIDFLCELPAVETVLVYHPNSIKIQGLSENSHIKKQYTATWKDLINSDAFFICSPSGTHVDYILKILDSCCQNDSLPYIYCEKPPAITKKDLEWLKSERSKLSDILYFGFNYRFSSLQKHLKQTISSGDLGIPIYANFTISHGLAFKKGMQKNWRFTEPSVFSKITGNLGIHYVDMCLDFFGSIKKVSIIERNVAKNSQSDTAIINLIFESGVICNIFLSYASVFSQTTDVFFSDGLFRENNSVIDIFHPRDTFNLDNEFCQPEPYRIDQNSELIYSESGLHESISYFISKVESGDLFPGQKYDQSLRTTEIFLNDE